MLKGTVSKISNPLEDRMASSNVQTCLKVLQENPELLKDLNKALTMVFAAANVDLSVEEKRDFLQEVANTISSADKGIHVHF